MRETELWKCSDVSFYVRYKITELQLREAISDNIMNHRHQRRTTIKEFSIFFSLDEKKST